MEEFPADFITETDALRSAPVWRSEPYILLFPLGIVLGSAGVLHWMLHALHLLPDYRPIFHAMTQIQGFMTSMATGFLFTMIPRRTGSAPPAGWQIGIGLLAPLVTTIAAWERHWFIAQASWLILVITIIGFAVRRFLSGQATRRPPNAFVWIPLALLMGVAGSIFAMGHGPLGASYPWLHSFGKGLVLQGMFIGFILGVGSLALPLMTRGEAPADAGQTARDWLARAANLVAAVLLVASFWIEATSSMARGMLLRAIVIVVVLGLGAKLWRLPTRSAWHARLIWISAWMVPLGYLIAALFPAQFKAGLHVTFITGFALLSLMVSTQVTFAHDTQGDLMPGRSWQVGTIGSLVGLAAIARVSMEFDPQRRLMWMGIAASMFLSATLMWAIFLVPKFLQRIRHTRRAVIEPS